MSKIKKFKQTINNLKLHEDNIGVYYLYVYHSKYGGFSGLPRPISEILIKKYGWKVLPPKQEILNLKKYRLIKSFDNYYLCHDPDDSNFFSIRTNLDFINAIAEARLSLPKDKDVQAYQIARIYINDIEPNLDDYDGYESVVGNYYSNIELDKEILKF